ncbi:hypothetical protein [Devosia salina]|uniref:EF-hand domain-containing protein n=1 Tax=Devosia salina TaxID=2860336 RepID=A0ABX8WNC8_9HYPH|nr:hypothetical protein [Devosia salina]QYO78531.1 hypothetical protein K1X15_08320 [Devosia salina]
MNIDATNGSLRLELVERLFQRADLDRNQALSVEEMAAFVPREVAGDAQSIVSGHDEDGDGQLSAAKFAGGILAAQTLQELMSVQEYRDAGRSERQADDLKAVNALFARADVDGDGLLSEEELAADRAIQFAQALDEGADVPQHMFAVRRDGAGDGQYGRDDIMVGRRLTDIADAVRLDDRAVLVTQFVSEQPATPAADPMPVSPETKDVAEAEPADAQEPPAIADVLREHVRMAEMSDVLIARLIQMLGAADRGTPEIDHQA